MAKERDLDERLDRVEAIIEQLESGDPSREEGERLFKEERQTLDKIREILDRGEGEVVELPESMLSTSQSRFVDITVICPLFTVTVQSCDFEAYWASR